MGVSKNNGTPKSSHFNRVFHEINHPFWGVFQKFLGVSLFVKRDEQKPTSGSSLEETPPPLPQLECRLFWWPRWDDFCVCENPYGCFQK